MLANGPRTSRCVAEDYKTKALLSQPLVGIRRRLNLPSEPPPAVVYTPLLTGYATTVAVLAGAAVVITLHTPADLATLLLGCLVIVAMSAFAVRSISGVDATWSASAFVHLALTLSLGPPGAIAAALADGLLGRALVGVGWFRCAFNTSTFTLANLGAWSVAHAFGSPITPRTAPLAGLGAGAAAWLIDHVLVAGVIRIASQGAISFGRSLRSGLAVLPHTLAYGWAAAGVALLYGQAGTVGFTMLLVPVLSAQAFLVLLARRTNNHQRELKEAEERERRRIARDLHDSVVQVVAGYSMRLAAGSDTIESELGPAGERWRDIMSRAAGDLRGAARDLRTLIVQIAPPTLEHDGLRATLEGLLPAIRETGMIAILETDGDESLDLRDSELVFRVAQEALRNVASHSEATVVRIELLATEGDATLTINDNGHGFTTADRERSRREGHIGTRGLEELAAQRGATLTIDSKPGEGTQLRLSILARRN